MVSPPTEEIMRKRLMSVNSTQESVQTCSKWLLHHRESIDKIANCWMDIYKQTNDKLRIALIYVLNDVVQKAACKRDINVTLTFHPHLINATTISSVTVKKAISRCVEVFGERNVYPAHIIEEMKTALVSRIATEKDESQNATEIIDFQKIIRAIESFYKNEMLTEKAREILSRSSFNFKESVQGRVKDRNEGIKALADMDSSRQKLISFLDTVEKHKQKGLLLHELMKKTENTFNLQLRDVTVINDAYERFAEGIKKTKEQLETMESSGCMLGESPPRDAPSPTAGDDPFVHGVDGEELAGGGDDMEMDDEDRPGTSGSSRCFLKSANEYTRASMHTGPPIQFNAPPPLNTQFIPLPTQSSGALPPPRPSVMDPRQARFFASQQQQQNYPSIPPPPGASPPPQQSQINQQQFFQQTNGGDHSTPNLSSPPMFNHPPPLIPRAPKFGLSFSVEPGEVVALVGPSGSGKSSCIALLENFYSPSGGKVLIDGIPVCDYEHHYIHEKIALVGQEPVLFARSISENVAYGLDKCTTVDVVEAAKMANAHSFIIQTREQYQTNVGEKGSQMSGGQKQRIAIARAIVRKPAILLLDEATSALDTESEHLVQEAIYKNMKGRSVILIAHRLSTVEKADKIVVIIKGQVEQMGTHEQLLSQEGIYRSLVQRQMIGGGGNGNNNGGDIIIGGDPTTSANIGVEEGEEENNNKNLNDGRDSITSLASGGGGRRRSRIGPRIVGSSGLSISPRTMAQTLMATSFTHSTSSLQSK